MAILHAQWFDRFGMFFYGVLIVAAAISFRNALKQPPPIFSTVSTLIGVTLLLVTISTHWPVSNFIFWIGDSGAYVNSANHLARIGSKAADFFPLYQAVMGIWSALFGKAYTPYANLLLGAGSVYGAYLLVSNLFSSRKIGLLAAFVFSLNIMTMWFSRIPFSENLMIALNLFLLYWMSRFEQEEDEGRRFEIAVVCGLLVGLISLTRITGLVWMVVITVYFLYEAFFRERRLQQSVVLYVVAFAGYAYSVAFALQTGSNYYINWQLKSFLPMLADPIRVVVFHVVWFLFILIGGLALRKARAPGKNLIKHFVEHHDRIIALIAFPGGIIAGVLLLKDGQLNYLFDQYAAFFQIGKIGQDEHYLLNYFGWSAYVIVPLGIATLLVMMRPFKRFGVLTFLLFGAMFLILAYVRPTFNKNHDVYLYWDRYIYSEVFIFYFVSYIAGLYLLLRTNLAKWGAVAVLVLYFYHSIYWAINLHGISYMQGGFDAVDTLAEKIESDGIVLFENRYDGPWLFANARHCFLTPLRISYGSKVRIDNAPFTQDTPLKEKKIINALRLRKNVYVVTMTNMLLSQKEILHNISGINGTIVDSFNAYTSFRPHNYKKINHNKNITARYVLTVCRYRRQFKK